MSLSSAKKTGGNEVESLIPTPTIGEYSVYIHVPFCTKKCDYCHFFVVKETAHAAFLESIKKEWALKKPLTAQLKLKSIYFGGGTPSLLTPSEINEVLSLFSEAIEENPLLEITIEANPENITLEKLVAFRKCGINRISIGVQALDNEMLKILGRTHSKEAAIRALHLSKEALFENISCDLMFEIPHQTLAMWKNTLNEVKKLPITHLSLYNLTFEEGAVFYRKKSALTPHLPDAETSLEMFQEGVRSLEEMGLFSYEISAFAKPGFHSVHNTGYWLARPFIGLGPSAFSFWGGERFQNICSLPKYNERLRNDLDPAQFRDPLSLSDRRKELLAVELRLRQGVYLPTFTKRHGALSEETVIALKGLLEKGLIEEVAQTIRLTEKGILFYDTASSEII